jgi:hypothetical protein
MILKVICAVTKANIFTPTKIIFIFPSLVNFTINVVNRNKSLCFKEIETSILDEFNRICTTNFISLLLQPIMYVRVQKD